MKTKFSTGNLSRQTVLYIALFASVTLIAFLFPPSADDFGWATKDGLTLFKRGFANYNGRYLGNFFAFALTRIPLILPFIKAATLTLVVFITDKISANKNLLLSIVTSILLVIPSPLFIQGYVWTAGFSNYYLSALIIASALYVLVFVNPDKTSSKILCVIFLAAAGVAGQLFMETYTLFTLAVSACAVIVLSKKNRRIDIAAVIYFAACIAGAVIMFTNGIYVKVLNKEDTYQSLQTGSDSLFGTVITAVKNLFGEVSHYFVLTSIPAIIALVIVLFVLYRQNRPESKHSRTAIKVLFSLCVLTLLAYGLAFVVVRDFKKVWYLLGVALVIFVFAVGLTVLKCVKQCAPKLAIYTVLLFLLCGPLALVYPVGPRCYVGAYFIVILIVHELYSQIKLTEKPAYIKAASAVLCAVLAVDLVCYAIVYTGQKHKVESAREQIASGETTIVFEPTPFRTFAYAIDTEYFSESFTKRFCRYYGLPEDITIVYK